MIALDKVYPSSRPSFRRQALSLLTEWRRAARLRRRLERVRWMLAVRYDMYSRVRPKSMETMRVIARKRDALKEKLDQIERIGEHYKILCGLYKDCAELAIPLAKDKVEWSDEYLAKLNGRLFSARVKKKSIRSYKGWTSRVRWVKDLTDAVRDMSPQDVESFPIEDYLTYRKA